VMCYIVIFFISPFI